MIYMDKSTLLRTVKVNIFFLVLMKKKKGISKIVGLNSYLSKKSITLDKLKRDI